MAKKLSVKLTANFERNLEEIESFLSESGAVQAYDALLNELLDTVLPNLERFPDMGRAFLEHTAKSVEVTATLGQLHAKLQGGELREYLFGDYLVLYLRLDGVIHLLSIKHHRQLSFDFEHLWVADK